MAAITAIQNQLWKTVRIGNYIQPVGNDFAESLSRQVAVDPSAADTIQIRIAAKPVPGQSDVVIRLDARELSPTNGLVVWQRPRMEANGKPPLLLRDYADFGPAYELDLPTEFAETDHYLSAVLDVANSKRESIEEIAKARQLDAEFLKQWCELLAIEPFGKRDSIKTTPAIRPSDTGRTIAPSKPK